MAVCRAPRSNRRRRPRDGCVVDTRRLAGEIRVWIVEWERKHPDLASSGGRTRDARGHLAGNETVGAVTILHERTVLGDPTGVGVPKRKIRDILKGKSDLTELRDADAIVAAIDSEAFYDGTLEVLPNPLAAPAARASCCGGSLNGALF